MQESWRAAEAWHSERPGETIGEGAASVAAKEIECKSVNSTKQHCQSTGQIYRLRNNNEMFHEKPSLSGRIFQKMDKNMYQTPSSSFVKMKFDWFSETSRRINKNERGFLETAGLSLCWQPQVIPNYIQQKQLS
ncbi:hypothetical protein STEG23_004002, partial [Scotinomys teguina]